MELTARHRITSVEWDERRTRGGDGRRDHRPANRAAGRRANRRRRRRARHTMMHEPRRSAPSCATDDRYDVLGTYLGVVADEN